MTIPLQDQFLRLGVKRGGVLMLPPQVALEFIDAARLAGHPILGVDSLVVTENSTTSAIDHVLDLSSAGSDTDTWSEARRFVEARTDMGFLFEIVT
jgi:hypothetical protein